MRVFFISLVIVLSAFSQAKAIDFSDDRGITASAFFGISHWHYSFRNSSDNKYGSVITPRIGYRFNATWEAGALYRYEKFGGYEKYSGLGVYGEWSFVQMPSGFRMITEAHAFHSKISGYIYVGGTIEDITEIGFTPCIAYRIANSPVDLKLRYLFVGYNHSSRYYKSDAPGCLGRGDWLIDASLRRLEIGASITF